MHVHTILSPRWADGSYQQRDMEHVYISKLLKGLWWNCHINYVKKLANDITHDITCCCTSSGSVEASRVITSHLRHVLNEWIFIQFACRTLLLLLLEDRLSVSTPVPWCCVHQPIRSRASDWEPRSGCVINANERELQCFDCSIWNITLVGVITPRRARWFC